MKRKQLFPLAIAIFVATAIFAVVVASSVRVQASPLTIDQFLADWDAYHLTAKVWQAATYSYYTWFLTGNTHGWANIREALDDIKDELGQGLVGEVEYPTYLETTGAGWSETNYYSPPGPPFTHPKKFSFWINLWYMTSAETIEITVSVETEPGICDPYDYQVYIGDVDPNSILVVDQLPLAGEIEIYIQQTAGNPMTIIYHAIIEEN